MTRQKNRREFFKEELSISVCSVNTFRRKGTSDRQIEIVQTMCACVLVGAEIGASQTTKKRARSALGAREFRCKELSL